MKRMKSVLALALTLIMFISTVTPAVLAAEVMKSEVDICADVLNALGSFKGSDKGFELERTPKRIEASVMLVRLLGKEAAAIACTEPHPFTDVPDWAQGYVSYMYSEGLTKGVSSTLFGSDDDCDVKMYVTFVLRALGYDDTKGDFTYDDSITYGRMNSLLTGEDALRYLEDGFTRGDMAMISYNALFVELNNEEILLLQKLYDEDAVEQDTAKKILDTIEAEDLVAMAEYTTWNYPYFSYTSEVQSELSVSRYAGQRVSVEVKGEGQDLDTNAILAFSYIYKWPDGATDVVTRYVTDGYEYVINVDGTKTKAEYDPFSEDDYDDADELDELEGTIYTILDRYKDVKIETLEDGSMIVTITFANNSKTAMNMAKSEMGWWADIELMNEYEYMIMPTKCEKTYTINADGLLIADSETIEFTYMEDGDTNKYVIAGSSRTTYNNVGEPVIITLPDDLDTYDEH